MNGKRCAIFLGTFNCGPPHAQYDVTLYVSVWRTEHNKEFARIFGSHSEAKRELKKWLPAWPGAKIVEERDL